MSKFKVGDKVRVVKVPSGATCSIGDVGTVAYYDGGDSQPFKVRFSEDDYWWGDQDDFELLVSGWHTFKVGDKAYYVSTDGGFPVGTRVTITNVAESSLPYWVKSGDRGSWATEDDLSAKNPRTPTVIRAEITALEAELAELTLFKVGDRVRIDLVGTVTEVDDDDELPIRVEFPGMESLKCPYFTASVLTKVTE